MRFKIITLAAAVAVLAGCSSGPAASPYQNGKTYAVANYKAGDTARLIGPTPKQWCVYVLYAFYGKGTDSFGVPLNAPSGNSISQDRQWVAGCVAGYYVNHLAQTVSSSPTSPPPAPPEPTYQQGYSAANQATRAAVNSQGGDTWWCGTYDPSPDAAASDDQNASTNAHPSGTQWFVGCMAGLKAMGINIRSQW
jgi:hypothetical protein